MEDFSKFENQLTPRDPGYYEEEDRLRKAFKYALAEEALLALDHPKLDKLFHLAWEQGHSNGYREVWIIFTELAELVVDEPPALEDERRGQEPRKVFTVLDLAGKVEGEGSVLSAIEYGIKPDEVPEGELRDLWTRACSMNRVLEPVASRIQRILNDAVDAPKASGQD